MTNRPKRPSRKKKVTIQVKKSKPYTTPSGKRVTRKKHPRTLKKFPNPHFAYRTINGQRRLCKITRKGTIEYVQVVEDRRIIQRIEQPRKVKQQYYLHGYYPKTMEKEIPDNIAKGIKEIGKDEYEHSIALDFERKMDQPQRMAVVEGGKTETLKIEDFELFGHTHPGQEVPRASTGDLRTMVYLEPEFIVAGKTGKIFIYNIEDPDKYRKWDNSHGSRKPTDMAIHWSEMFKKLNKKQYKDNPEAQNVSPYNYEQSEIGRELFFELTGVKIYPYRKGTIIEMKDDPHFEKWMPTVHPQYQQKYHKQRKEHEKAKGKPTELTTEEMQKEIKKDKRRERILHILDIQEENETIFINEAELKQKISKEDYEFINKIASEREIPGIKYVTGTNLGTRALYIDPHEYGIKERNIKSSEHPKRSYTTKEDKTHAKIHKEYNWIAMQYLGKDKMTPKDRINHLKYQIEALEELQKDPKLSKKVIDTELKAKRKNLKMEYHYGMGPPTREEYGIE